MINEEFYRYSFDFDLALPSTRCFSPVIPEGLMGSLFKVVIPVRFEKPQTDLLHQSGHSRAV